MIFDYGEVISLSQSQADRAVIASLAGAGDHAAAERFWTAYSAHRDGLDQGAAGVAAYWRAIARDTGATWDDARVHELWAADFRSWLSINPDIVELLADLRAGGTPLALLSQRRGRLRQLLQARAPRRLLHRLLRQRRTRPAQAAPRHLPARPPRPRHHPRRRDLHRQPRNQRRRGPGARHHRARVHRRRAAAGVPRRARGARRVQVGQGAKAVTPCVQGASSSAEPAGGASGGRTVVTVPSPHMIITQAGIACPRAAGGHGDDCSKP